MCNGLELMKRDRYIINDRKWERVRKKMRKDISEKGIYTWLMENVDYEDEESTVHDVDFVNAFIKGSIDNRIIVRCKSCNWRRILSGVEELSGLKNVKCCENPVYDWSYYRLSDDVSCDDVSCDDIVECRNEIMCKSVKSVVG
jgi:hypothetical protein